MLRAAGVTFHRLEFVGCALQTGHRIEYPCIIPLKNVAAPSLDSLSARHRRELELLRVTIGHDRRSTRA